MAEKYTPMMEQYLSVKKNYPDTLLFYRVGDFYEMFFEDALTASKELDLVLTGKSAGVEERVPMCGVPFHAVNAYIPRLVNKGYKVAICEQLTDPKESQGLVERDVVRIITPGTMVDEIQDDRQSVYLAAIEDMVYGYSIAIVEMSTGENYLQEINHQNLHLIQSLLKADVRECVVSSNFDKKLQKQIQEQGILISISEETKIDSSYNSLTIDIKKEALLKAYGRMLNYLQNTQKQTLTHLRQPSLEKEEDALYMDFSTRLNLELVQPLRQSAKAVTLWSFLDHCTSAMGSRELKKWIERPLIQKEKIENRLDKVGWMIENFMDRSFIRDSLSRIYDLERIITRCAIGSANAVDVQRLGKTLAEVPAVLDRLPEALFPEIQRLDALPDLYKEIDMALVENPPLLLSNGGLFKDGYNAELDEARSIQKNGQDFIMNLEAKERERTGIKTLKIAYNKVFGYYIEISKAAAQSVKEEWGYTRKQTLTNNERFISRELKVEEDRILHAAERAVELEKKLFQELMNAIKNKLWSLQVLARALAQIDVYANLAEMSQKHQYVRPIFDELVLDIVDGKHPILDAQMKHPRYVANAIHLDAEKYLDLITGPNMGGKSTYMRQVALIVLLAQIGCYVPAKKCRMPIFDKIFTRIGASDDILSGHSTFMVEMKEANQALQEATSHSLILFDEIGRGTSTYDGMALAQAMMEYIAHVVKAKTMFSTHYHELTEMENYLDCVINEHVSVKQKDKDVTFLYKVEKGAAGHSYGINVARLAGLPESVLERAKDIQKDLENTDHLQQASFQFVEMKKEDSTISKLKDCLNNVDMDDLSPKQAWQFLADLQEEVKKHE
ncbi:DNA mismatch repair protein MutS [Bulleidia sp. zg-1006]|uniref:DNA mismatch repair protein MutS n=1 Tax=Bulleidia sp. zg-1006 TaxID=2806552 RepID=UPI001939C2D9|nr:DNA mismatch repair protein MutS [Bulleidia sp. zg-1006]QRG86780.1 DNA mismatch repair protein MutS [Bulleidia sp. zg-1006]